MDKEKPIIVPKEVIPDTPFDADKWLEYTKKQKIKFENI